MAISAMKYSRPLRSAVPTRGLIGIVTDRLVLAVVVGVGGVGDVAAAAADLHATRPFRLDGGREIHDPDALAADDAAPVLGELATLHDPHRAALHPRPTRRTDQGLAALLTRVLARQKRTMAAGVAPRRPSDIDTREASLLRCEHRVSTLDSRVLTTVGDRPWRDEAAPSAPWTFAHRRSFGPSSRNMSRPPRRSVRRRSSSAMALACPARPSAASSPSSKAPAC